MKPHETVLPDRRSRKRAREQQMSVRREGVHVSGVKGAVVMPWAEAVLVESFREPAVHSPLVQQALAGVEAVVGSAVEEVVVVVLGEVVEKDSNRIRNPGFAQASRSREARINADKLHVHTPEEDLDSEDEAMIEALNSRAVSVLPMGIYRREHKDEGVIVATTAELEAAENAQAIPPTPSKEEESLWVDGDADEPLLTDESAEDGGIWKNNSKTPVIKKEPGLDDSMDLDIEAKADAGDKDKQASKTPAPQTKKPKQDPEEAMIQTDLEILANELGAVEISEGEDGKTEGPSNKDGRMYLFQFPPVLPPLKPITQPSSINKVKPEPGEGEDNVLESTPAAADTEPVDLTNDKNTTGFNVPGFEDPEQKAGFMSSLLSTGGMVGQLKVRKSGRVELDWGGSTMELNPATGMNFLTTAVIIEENDEKPRPGVIGGESIGMGKIMGRFVLAPKWDDEEDWEVSSEDLRIE
ncbi:hypothetical protein FOXG_01663 [Fusarium oxysporum f. sp. lycopersici 4287]|nr:hypothetical protein FOXG_01663 [Fusarium oxysporum f. sp. lycopersici 4287]KNA96491.1 hypothetical protein FOXG_01663 [Fusarium oxysporum f. sp. lycopersici 4287]